MELSEREIQVMNETEHIWRREGYRLRFETADEEDGIIMKFEL